MGGQAPFPIQPELTAVAIGYKNTELIADSVAPRVPVGVKNFKYTKWTKEEPFTVPDTKVGRKSKPNEVEFTGTEVTDTCQDYGLDDAIPQDDIDQAPSNYNPVSASVEGVSNLIALDREVRVAGVAFDSAQYSTANKVTLSGTSQFSDFTNSDPLGVILTGLDACIMRPNVMVIGQAVYTKLIQHPKIVKAMFGNAGDSGIATRKFLASLFEMDEVLVGSGWYNTALRGQTASYSRIWGKHIAMLRRDSNPNQPGKMSFMWTAQFKTRMAGADADRNIGPRGGQRVRVWESVKEVVSANDLGYMIVNAVA
jgi:hypothetical protein